MRYVLADVAKAQKYFSLDGRIVKAGKVALNEKGIMFNTQLPGATLEQKAELLGGHVLSAAETKEALIKL